MVAAALPRLVFGLAVPESAVAFDTGVGTLIRWIGARAGLDLVRFQVPSYESLAQQMIDGALQIAWLPPIVFVQLERDGVVAPLVTSQRTAGAEYQSVLVVRRSSPITTLDGLRGASAAWVDPLSASGYVLPRLQLAAVGIDPRTVFGAERFFGSHGAAVRAVIDGKADVAATFGGIDAGPVSRRGWSDPPPPNTGLDGDGLRVLVAFGAIPVDVIAVRHDVPLRQRAPLANALVEACDDPLMSPIARRIFGVEAFTTDGFATYDGLRRTLDAAAARGLLDPMVAPSTSDPAR
jgi:phosphonate transport system substrate-binding protein